MVTGTVLNDTTAIFLQAKQTFVDIYGKERQAGEQWLVTSEQASIHINDVYEQYVDTRYRTVLREDEFCYILDPMGKDGKNQLGKKILKTGPDSFFLQPGESFEGGIQKVFILAEDEALLLRANEAHTEADGTVRNAVDRWMVHGPCRYTLPVEV
jgi:major vault protein